MKHGRKRFSLIMASFERKMLIASVYASFLSERMDTTISLYFRETGNWTSPTATMFEETRTDRSIFTR